ncbi:MAG: hypothetical protein WCT52_00950 [Candidatus Micrarchaeia archaeon]
MQAFTTGSSSKISATLRTAISERLTDKSKPFDKLGIISYARALRVFSHKTHAILGFLVKPENKEVLSKLEGLAVNSSAKEQLMRELDNLEMQLRQSSRKSFGSPLTAQLA